MIALCRPKSWFLSLLWDRPNPQSRDSLLLSLVISFPALIDVSIGSSNTELRMRVFVLFFDIVSLCLRALLSLRYGQAWYATIPRHLYELMSCLMQGGTDFARRAVNYTNSNRALTCSLISSNDCDSTRSQHRRKAVDQSHAAKTQQQFILQGETRSSTNWSEC